MATFGYIDFSTKPASTNLLSLTCDAGELVQHPSSGSSTQPITTAAGRLRPGAFGEQEYYYFKCPPPSADYSVEVDLTTIDGSGTVDLFARMRKAGTNLHTYMARRYQGKFQLYRWVENGATQLGSDVADATAHRTMKLSVSGTGASVSLTVYVDDVAVITYNDTDADRHVSPGVAAFGFYSVDSIGDTHGVQINSVRAGSGDIWRPNLFFLSGNSQVAGLVTTLGADLIAGITADNLTAQNLAASGRLVADMTSADPAVIGAAMHNLVNRCVILLFDGTNSYGDVTGGNKTGAQVFADLQAYVAAVNAYGYSDITRYIMTTVPNRNYDGSLGGNADPGDINTRIAAGNALTVADTTDWNVVWDVNAALGSNPATYTVEGLHLTQTAANSILPTGVALINAQFSTGRRKLFRSGFGRRLIRRYEQCQ